MKLTLIALACIFSLNTYATHMFYVGCTVKKESLENKTNYHWYGGTFQDSFRGTMRHRSVLVKTVTCKDTGSNSCMRKLDLLQKKLDENCMDPKLRWTDYGLKMFPQKVVFEH